MLCPSTHLCFSPSPFPPSDAFYCPPPPSPLRPHKDRVITRTCTSRSMSTGTGVPTTAATLPPSHRAERSIGTATPKAQPTTSASKLRLPCADATNLRNVPVLGHLCACPGQHVRWALHQVCVCARACWVSFAHPPTRFAESTPMVHSLRSDASQVVSPMCTRDMWAESGSRVRGVCCAFHVILLRHPKAPSTPPLSPSLSLRLLLIRSFLRTRTEYNNGWGDQFDWLSYQTTVNGAQVFKVGHSPPFPFPPFRHPSIPHSLCSY
jgi:hypothetical protein